MKNLLGSDRIHLETAQGTKDQNIKYCSKEDTRIDGPWEFGDRETHQGTRTDLNAVAEDVKAGKSLEDIAENTQRNG